MRRDLLGTSRFGEYLLDRDAVAETEPKRYCWCGNEALPDYILFSTVVYSKSLGKYQPVEYGFCAEHKEQWRRKHPFVYIDGIGVNMLEMLNAVADKATQTTAKGVGYLSYFPCVFSGSGVFSELQAKEMKRIVASYRDEVKKYAHKPLVVVNNPFSQILACPDMHNRPDRLRLALKYLYRPSVWIVVTDGSLTTDEQRDIVRLANKATPLTYIMMTYAFSPTMRGAWNYWNTAIRLLFEQNRSLSKRKSRRGNDANGGDEQQNDMEVGNETN